MTAARRRFTQEFKDELCREVINTSKPIKDVATAYGVGPEAPRNWLNKYREANGGTEADLTVSERARNRSPVASASTTPTICRCASPTRRSTRRCTCNLGAHSPAILSPICEQVGRCEFHAPGHGIGRAATSPPT